MWQRVLHNYVGRERPAWKIALHPAIILQAERAINLFEALIPLLLVHHIEELFPVNVTPQVLYKYLSSLLNIISHIARDVWTEDYVG